MHRIHRWNPKGLITHLLTHKPHPHVIINTLSFCLTLSLSNLTNYKSVAFRSLPILNSADFVQAKFRISGLLPKKSTELRIGSIYRKACTRKCC